MQKESLIEILENIDFVCVDEPEESELLFVDMANNRPKESLAFLEGQRMKWPSSKGTIRSIERYKQNPSYDNFHNASHFIIVDKIIHFLKTGEGNYVEFAINHSLNCGVLEQEAIDALLSLTRQPSQKAS